MAIFLLIQISLYPCISSPLLKQWTYRDWPSYQIFSHTVSAQHNCVSYQRRPDPNTLNWNGSNCTRRQQRGLKPNRSAWGAAQRTWPVTRLARFRERDLRRERGRRDKRRFMGPRALFAPWRKGRTLFRGCERIPGPWSTHEEAPTRRNRRGKDSRSREEATSRKIASHDIRLPLQGVAVAQSLLLCQVFDNFNNKGFTRKCD